MYTHPAGPLGSNLMDVFILRPPESEKRLLLRAILKSNLHRKYY